MGALLEEMQEQGHAGGFDSDSDSDSTASWTVVEFLVPMQDAELKRIAACMVNSLLWSVTGQAMS